MSTPSGRVFALVLGTGKDFCADWGYIPATGVPNEDGYIVLQTWNCRYDFCRVIFSQASSEKETRKGRLSEIKPPALYIVCDLASNDNRVLAYVFRYPEHEARIFVSFDRKKKTKECSEGEWTFDAIRKIILQGLELTVKKEASSQAADFLREFDLRFEDEI